MPRGTGFTHAAGATESGTLATMFTNTAKPAVAEAIGRLGAGGFFDNIRRCEAAYLELAGGKSGAHSTARDATQDLAKAGRKWDAAMRVIVNLLDEAYDDADAAQRADHYYILQPLLDADAAAHARVTAAAAKKSAATSEATTKK